MTPFILASASPRRKKLLKSLGLKFKVIPSNIDEDKIKVQSPYAFVKKAALLKALEVAKRVRRGIIIGCDTIVLLPVPPKAGKGKALGKPKNFGNAKRMLKSLSGSTHYVLTAIALVDAKTKQSVVEVEKTKLRMKKLTDKQIERFAKKHLDKAGSYAIQENGDEFIELIEGSFSNAVGLPVERLKKMLEKFRLVNP